MAGGSGDASKDNTHISIVTLPILNSCLALTKHLMAAKDKSYIQDAVVSRFSLEVVMVARETLHTHCSPKEKYAYRGPNKVVNVRDRSIHAFDGIYSKCVELDALNRMPVIACPSEDLGILLSFNNDPIVVDARFRQIENEISELKRTFHQYTDVVRSNNPLPTVDQASSIPPATRRRLVSESNKRRRTDNGVEYLSESEDDEFKLPRDQVKKLERRTYSDRLKDAPPNSDRQLSLANKKPNRPPATWGKAKSLNNSHLSGSPPEIFMFKCRLNVEEENVKEHFKALEIDLPEVCKMTKHAEARSHSFKLTVATAEDYEKILTGNYTPPYVGVRRFIPAKRIINKENSNSQSGVTTQAINDFLSESPPRFMQTSTVEKSDPANTHNGQ